MNIGDPCTHREKDEPYIFEVWRRGGHIVGTQRQDFGTEQVKRFTVIHRFQTSFGWFVIVSDDPVITFQHAIFFAKAVAFGNVVKYRVDLKGIQP